MWFPHLNILMSAQFCLIYGDVEVGGGAQGGHVLVQESAKKSNYIVIFMKKYINGQEFILLLSLWFYCKVLLWAHTIGA